jgi:tetratricopeptide (TPR) repeat protein
LASQLVAQEERSLLRKGNSAFEKGEIEKAKELYQESLKVDPSFGKAQYNMGHTYYSAGDLAAAAEKYEIASADAIDKTEKAWAYHNQGNCYLNAGIQLMNNPPQPDSSGQAPPDPSQYIQQSIRAYKNALRNDPTDEDTRYNLAYAQKLIDQDSNNDQSQDQDQEQNQDQEEQEKSDEGDKNEDENKGDEQDKGDEGDKGDEQDKGDQGDEQDDKEGEQEQTGEPEKKEGMSKKEAEQMLDALDKQEKDLQQKKGKERMNGKAIKIDKDW